MQLNIKQARNYDIIQNLTVNTKINPQNS